MDLADESEILAKKMIEINFNTVQWIFANFGKYFDKNGKSEFEITFRQYSILVLINKFKMNTLSDISKITGVSKSSISLTIDKLTEEGYIEKCPAKEGNDKRRTFLKTTAKAQRAIDEADERLKNIFKKSYGNLDDNKKENLKIAIDNLSKLFY